MAEDLSGMQTAGFNSAMFLVFSKFFYEGLENFMKLVRIFPKKSLRVVAALTLASAVLPSAAWATDYKLLNVSYDPTRELYSDINKAFAADWQQKNPGDTVDLELSNGGSDKQALAVINGLPADVVTLANSADVQAISDKAHLFSSDWRSAFPNNATPYTSVIVFLVRKGNPKNIQDWGDLVNSGVTVVAPSPKTSGGGRYDYVAARIWALQQALGDLTKLNNPADAADDAAAVKKAQAYLTALYTHIPVLDSGARGSTITFTRRNIGDVELTYENEAYQTQKEYPNTYDIVVPSITIEVDPPVAVVTQNAQAHGVGDVAKAYLDFLYSPEGQRIIAHDFYRPIYPQDADPEDLKRFVKVDAESIALFGGWPKAQQDFFATGGEFDQIYQPPAQ
jgi:sulfate/thiosulfate transport system substrate-binding protein